MMKVAQTFIYSAIAILMLTAISKIISSFGNGNILHTHDPIIGIPFRCLLLFASSIEIAVALICLFCARSLIKIGLLAWLATSFTLYRIDLILIGWHKPCSCLGNLTDAIHISPKTGDMIMKVVLAYLLIGSYGCLFWLWRQRKKASLPESTYGSF